jgi:hypothetical protein
MEWIVGRRNCNALLQAILPLPKGGNKLTARAELRVSLPRQHGKAFASMRVMAVNWKGYSTNAVAC